MSTCRICASLRRCLGLGSEPLCEALWRSHWDECDAWERAHSYHDDLWWSDSDSNRALTEEAQALWKSDPEAAFRLLLEAAEAGSAWAMENVARYYHAGNVVAADFDRAADYYYRAICAGSWLATIGYARLLAAQDRVDECEAVLQDGIRQDFVPAYFWLARLRYDRAPTRATCREIKRLLEYAAERGHPDAKQTLGWLMMKGKFGILAIPRGLRLLAETVPPLPDESESAPAESVQAPTLRVAAQE